MLRWIAIAALIALAAALAEACSAPWPTTCTVGYAGTDVNITVNGTGADDVCSQLRKQGLTNTTGANGNVPAGAGYATQPTGTLVCQYTVKGLTYAVRDEGILKLYGTAMCAALSREPA